MSELDSIRRKLILIFLGFMRPESGGLTHQNEELTVQFNLLVEIVDVDCHIGRDRRSVTAGTSGAAIGAHPSRSIFASKK